MLRAEGPCQQADWISALDAWGAFKNTNALVHPQGFYFLYTAGPQQVTVSVNTFIYLIPFVRKPQ